MSKIANKFLAQVPANTLKGNNTGSTANVTDLTATQVTAMLNLFTSSLQGLTPASGGGTTDFLRADGSWTTINLTTNVSNTLPIANGGTGQTGANAAFAALSPMTTLGDIIYENSTPAPARLAGNISATLAVLTQTGTGSVSAAPVWTSSTGTGNVVLSASPTLTGTVSAAAISTSGNLGIGTSASSAAGISLIPTLTGSAQYGINNNPTYTATATTAAYTYLASASTSATSFTLPHLIDFYSNDNGKGSGSTINNRISFYSSVPTTGTNNAVLADSTSFSGNWFLNQSGTLASTLGGNLTVSGQLGVGESSVNTSVIVDAGGIGPAQTSNYAFNAEITSNATVTSTFGAYRSGMVVGASTAVTNVYAFDSTSFTITAGGSATRFAAFRDGAASGHPATNNAWGTDNQTFTGNWFINQSGTDPSLFGGQFGILGAASASDQFSINGTSTLSGATQRAVNLVFTTTSAATAMTGIRTALTAGASAAITSAVNFSSVAPVLGASATITRFTGVSEPGAATHIATNNASFTDNVAYTGNWFLNQSGSDPSTLAGAVTLTNLAGTGTRPVAANSSGMLVIQTAAQGLTSLGIFSGKTAISSASTSQAVTFSTAYAGTSYSVIANFLNTTDSNPQFQPITITAQSTTGFTATWDAPTATANYVLSWLAVTDN